MDVIFEELFLVGGVPFADGPEERTALGKGGDGEDEFGVVYKLIAVAVRIIEEWIVLGVHENVAELGFKSENGIQVGLKGTGWQRIYVTDKCIVVFVAHVGQGV
ncbi:hypothetical protein DL96DRAFT_1718450 [Flagelloscypha sp. PMI_526]|nr:hypothetical protein DL96DRAFT_1718450 [Flagelloscypha sp. PMI_526]